MRSIDWHYKIGAWNDFKVKQDFETWSGQNLGSKASPDVIPQPFKSEQWDLAIETKIGAWNGFKVKQDFQTWKAHNSSSRGPFDILTSALDRTFRETSF